ncbi:DUF6531 domain-containing protein [Escherichia coli]
MGNNPVDPVTGAYATNVPTSHSGPDPPLSFTRFHSSVLPLHGLTGVGWSDSWSESPGCVNRETGWMSSAREPR